MIILIAHCLTVDYLLKKDKNFFILCEKSKVKNLIKEKKVTNKQIINPNNINNLFNKIRKR